MAYEFAREEMSVDERSVIFGGVILTHFGHIIVDSCSRLWYYAKNPNENDLYVFLMERSYAVPKFVLIFCISWV